MTTVLPPVIAPDDEDVIVSGDECAVLDRSPSPKLGLIARIGRVLGACPAGYAIAGAGALAGVVVFALWFRTGTFYAHGDLAPFVRNSLLSEFGGQWTHQNSGAGGPTYELVRAVELVFSGIAHGLGGGDALGQRLLFAAIFAFAASGVAALAARFVQQPALIFVAGVVGAFSPFTMVNLPNFLVPICIGCIAWSGALTIDAARAAGRPRSRGEGAARRNRPRVLALISLAAAYLALNPPLLAVLAVWIVALPAVAAASTTTGWAGARRSVVFLGRAALWAVPLALWWLVPYVVAMHTATASGTITANTDVFSWSWTHANGSMDRVLALVAKWNWPDPQFGAKGSGVSNPLWLWLAFALPVGLLAAPLAARAERRRPALMILAAALAAAFVAKGLNAPARPINVWTYKHVPGMFLLREPMSKVGTLLVPAAVIGWVITVDGLAHRAREDQSRRNPRAWLLRAGVVFLVAAPLLFAAPMLSGAVVRSSDRVRVPAAWDQVARVVDDAPVQGKALVLPLDDFYQVPTTWGYYGEDTLPVEVLRRPAITRNPQRYIGDAGDFGELVDAVQNALIAGKPDAVPGALRALAVSHIVVRKDIDYASPIRRVQMVAPGPLLAALASVRGVHRVATTSVADVYEFGGGAEPVDALSGTIAAPGAQGEALTSLVATAPVGTAIVTTDRKDAPVVRGEAWYVDGDRDRTITPQAAADWTYQWHASDATLVELARAPRGIVLREPVSINIADKALATRAATTVAATGKVEATTIDGSIIDLSAGRGYARIAQGALVRPYTAGPRTRLGSWSNVGDCNRYDATPAALNSSVDTEGGRPVMKLRASRHSACVEAPVVAVGSDDVVHVSLEQRNVAGASPRTCLWQQGLGACAPLSWSATRDGVWYRLNATYQVPARAGKMMMFLYADEPAAGTIAASEAWYRDITVSKLVAGKAVRVYPSPSPSGHVRLAAQPVAVATAFDAPAPAVGVPAPVGNCAQSDHRSLRQQGITATSINASDPTAVRISARRDSGCVTMPVTGIQRSVTYELSFHAKVERGAAPRVCLWEETAQHCARFDSVETPSDGNGHYRYRGRIDPDASMWQLFLYADATGGGTTIDYSGIRFLPIADESLILRSALVRTPPAPAIVWHQDGPARYRVDVHNATAPFVLTLAEAYSSEWHVQGLPSGASAEHVELDGYRNGWAIDTRGDLHLTITYAPARSGHIAFRVSQIAVGVLVLSFLARPAWRRRPRRRIRRPQARPVMIGGLTPGLSFPPGPRRVTLPEAGLDFWA